MKMKRFAAMLLAGTMLTGLCACGSSGGDKTAGSGSSGDELKVSVVLKTEASEHWQLIKAGCEQYEKDNPGVKVDVKGPPSETSYDEQTNMIDTDINGGGYDAYVIAPLQSDSVAAQIAATDKPVIALDTNINSDKVVSFEGNCCKGKVKEIGRQAGYRDNRHFCKMFKRVTGMTPQEYRKLNV